MSEGVELIKLGLSVWYLNYVLQHTHGPFTVFERVRWAGLPACFACTAAWVCASLWFLPSSVHTFFAICGIATIVNPYVLQANLVVQSLRE